MLLADVGAGAVVWARHIALRSWMQSPASAVCPAVCADAWHGCFWQGPSWLPWALGAPHHHRVAWEGAACAAGALQCLHTQQARPLAAEHMVEICYFTTDA